MEILDYVVIGDDSLLRISVSLCRWLGARVLVPEFVGWATNSGCRGTEKLRGRCGWMRE